MSETLIPYLNQPLKQIRLHMMQQINMKLTGGPYSELAICNLEHEARKRLELEKRQKVFDGARAV